MRFWAQGHLLSVSSKAKYLLSEALHSYEAYIRKSLLSFNVIDSFHPLALGMIATCVVDCHIRHSLDTVGD